MRVGWGASGMEDGVREGGRRVCWGWPCEAIDCEGEARTDEEEEDDEEVRIGDDVIR